MKIGLLTFQHSINFGAQLQCYALQKVLKDMGYDVEVIQYYPTKILPFYRNINFSKNGIKKGLIYLILRFLFQNKARKVFLNFKNKHYVLTQSLFSNEDLNQEAIRFDAIVVGSDQVWTPAYQGKRTYFLDLPQTYSGLKVSYAACCALNIVNEKANKSKLKELLIDFNAISVRNNETYAFVENMTSIKAPIVLDPTFLCRFENVSSSLEKPYHNYILTYVLGDEIMGGGHEKMIEEIKKVYGDIPVVSIVLIENCPHYFSWADKTYWTLDPSDWLFLISNATFLYTDSFHGLVFALKYQLPFVAYYTEKLRAARFLDMAKRFDLDTWIVSSVEDARNKKSLYRKLKYANLDKLIESEVQFSLSFLKKALNKKYIKPKYSNESII